MLECRRACWSQLETHADNTFETYEKFSAYLISEEGRELSRLLHFFEKVMVLMDKKQIDKELLDSLLGHHLCEWWSCHLQHLDKILSIDYEWRWAAKIGTLFSKKPCECSSLPKK